MTQKEKKEKVEKDLKDLSVLAKQIKEFTHKEREKGIILDQDYYQEHGVGGTEKES